MCITFPHASKGPISRTGCKKSDERIKLSCKRGISVILTNMIYFLNASIHTRMQSTDKKDTPPCMRLMELSRIVTAFISTFNAQGSCCWCQLRHSTTIMGSKWNPDFQHDQAKERDSHKFASHSPPRRIGSHRSNSVSPCQSCPPHYFLFLTLVLWP